MQVAVLAENVRKTYSKTWRGQTKEALKGVSLTIPVGETFGFIGPNGAGKSTLIHLLLRLLEPQAGTIAIGGVDVRDFTLTALREQIGLVSQQVLLFNASVRDNIALGRPSATAQQIEDAARAANIHERILRLPRGYDSVIGEDAQLSGGEQQRLSIARAVLLDPPVLVLDEATAAADADNEVAIQEALSRFAQGRTLLVIAHRLDTVMHADQILVIHDGTLHEQGRHADLLAHGGLYARLWQLGDYARSESQAVQPC